MYGVIYNSDQLASINSLTAYSIGTQQGCSIQISNQSQYGMMILSGSTQVDYLHPYEYVIFPMLQNVIIQPDPATFANTTQPYSKVAYKLIKGNVSYQRGSIWQQNGIVANESTQAVPTQSQSFYGTGADGVFSPTSNHTFGNIANQAEIKNFTSVNIPSGVTVNFTNPAQYVLWYVNGNVTINGTINSANAYPNGSTAARIKLFQGSIVLPPAGNGGAGGNGGNAIGNGNPTNGGSGGTGTCYGSGNGGGGGGGFPGAGAGANGAQNGNTGGSGSQTSGSGGIAGSTSGHDSILAQNGLFIGTIGTATLIIIANGQINIGGTINANGVNGASGGIGGSSVSNANLNVYSPGGGGGTTGNGFGGNGGNGLTATGGSGFSYGGSGGGGSGGSGGGVVCLYAAQGVNITGTIRVNGGGGGSGGSNGTGATQNGGSGSSGTSGQAGSIIIYQYNNSVAVT